ncbi:MAG: hypothetical protein ACREJM_00050 [Candidatus Saccharimonadales bacterium]
MNMRGLSGALWRDRRLLAGAVVAVAAVAWLLLYKLGSLTGGLSAGELAASGAPVGWHGIYDQPFHLPLELARSVLFFLFPDHGQTLTRLPNAFFGALAIASFGGLIRLWHGRRTAILATAMFAAGAWTLHVSRLASFDILYLWAFPALLLGHFALRRYYRNPYVWFGSLMTWGLLIYVPGMVWFAALDIWLQRRFIAGGWREARRWWMRVAYILAGLVWLPLLVAGLSRSPGTIRTWLGLPAHITTGWALVKQFAEVPVHLFVSGPENPRSWLGHAPVLDIFALAACALGIYFYVTHWRASRSHYLALLAAIGFVLVGLGGPVPLSLLVSLLYVSAATGLAYLLHEWLKIFPNNPLARGLGLGLIIVAVALSCAYNYRAYFVAWPHAAATKATFQYRRHH